MRRGRRLALGLGVIVLVAGACWVVRARWVRAMIDQARQEMAARHYAAARSRLARLAPWGSAGGEVDYLLGCCEQAAGRPDAALASWSRVPSRSAFAVPA